MCVLKKEERSRNRIHIKSRQDPTVTDLHDGASCQVEISQFFEDRTGPVSIWPSKHVPNPLADSQETTDPPTAESPTPKQGVTDEEAEAMDPGQAERINHRRSVMAIRSGRHVKPLAKLNLSIYKTKTLLNHT
ncbi:hypothetical protein QYM36_006433 [Artemia franciscana]|uniref:Uncharacterized protein n=1 Tax=Artemia franciscana TaxID=6661 RepID=A0AA88I0E4_ARTSF|nr:hypothetical protein QYM36_006433 [Artemia franciscana]